MVLTLHPLSVALCSGPFCWPCCERPRADPGLHASSSLCLCKRVSVYLKATCWALLRGAQMWGQSCLEPRLATGPAAQSCTSPLSCTTDAAACVVVCLRSINVIDYLRAQVGVLGGSSGTVGVRSHLAGSIGSASALQTVGMGESRRTGNDT